LRRSADVDRANETKSELNFGSGGRGSGSGGVAVGCSGTASSASAFAGEKDSGAGIDDPKEWTSKGREKKHTLFFSCN
jgi:hypothetical protein